MARKRLTKAQKKEKIAYQLYQNRQILNRSGSSDSDWQTAGEILQKPYKRFLFASHKRLIGLEKRLWEPLLKWADNQALLSLLGLVGNIGILIAVASYVGSEKQRREAEVLNAWQTLTSAYGQSGSGGRIQALEFLNASPGANWRRRFPWFCAPHPLCTWPAENLSGINLAANDGSSVYLAGLKLPDADLSSANLQDAYLGGTNLQESNLWGANLESAILLEANLEQAVLGEANLQGADLGGVNLQGANLLKTNLTGSNLGGANLQGAILLETNLKEAYLLKANLERAILLEANLQEAYLWGANLQGAVLWKANLEGADLGFANLEGALLCETVLPAATDLDPNRDCDRLEDEAEGSSR